MNKLARKRAAIIGIVIGLSFAWVGGAKAEPKSMHVAFGDIPGTSMLNFMVAVKRAEARGVQVRISFLQSEDIAAQAVISGQADIGVGTPYGLIQSLKAPVRMFFQLSKLAFFPVINTEKFKTWKDLDGQPMFTSSRGSGTEAIMNLMASKHGIKYSSMNYVPGSAPRANAMMQGRIHATIVDAKRRTILLNEGKGRFALLPLPKIDASDEALYANLDFIKNNQAAIDILLEELVLTWREVNANPGYIAQARTKFNLLPKMPAGDVAEIAPYYREAVETGIFDANGGGERAAKGDFEFYGFAGAIKGDVSTLKIGDFWHLGPLNRALDKLGRQ